jgi:hypothetical protein
MRTKVQDHSSTARAKKVQQVSTRPANKSITSTLMEADLRRVGKKTPNLHGRKARAKCMPQEKIISKTEVATPTRAEAGAKIKKSLHIVCFMRKIWTIGRDCPIFLESKKKMTQKQNQPSASSTVKEVNHTSHWHQPSYQNFNPCPEYQPNYHRYPSQYYQAYNYTPHTSQIHTSQPTTTYPSAPLQITYPTASSQTSQTKTEPNNPPSSPPNKQPVSQPLELFILLPEVPI